MIAFEVCLNGKKMCTAGIDEVKMLSSILSWRGPQPYKHNDSLVAKSLRLNVKSLSSDSEKHLRWIDRKLKHGDVVSITVVDVASVNKPCERQRPDPKADLRKRKQYVRQMAKQLEWKLKT